jgi:flagellar motor switch protein FliN/FliY
MQDNEMNSNIDRLLDVEMNVTVRFGKTEIPLREVVRFGVGSMIELNRSVDEPVEILVNNRPFARGEVVVVDGYYGVRVTEVGTVEESARSFLSHGTNETQSEVTL